MSFSDLDAYLFIAMGALIGGYGVLVTARDLRSGVARLAVGTFARSERPLLYWISVGVDLCCIVAGLICVGAALIGMGLLKI
jgi:hypothetical protein